MNHTVNEDAIEVIKRWMETSPFRTDDIRQYMREAASRAETLLGVEIPIDDPVEFVSGMRECKLDAVFEIGYDEKEKK